MSNFWTDERGAYAIMAALLMPVLVGAGVLATEVGSWAFRHEQMQGATDAAAIAGVIAKVIDKATGTAVTTQAENLVRTSGFVNGLDGVIVQVNSPPASGPYVTWTDAVEVIVQRPYAPILAKFFRNASVTVKARSVAVHKTSGGACVLSLSKTASKAAYFQGSTNVTLNGCDVMADSSASDAILAAGSSSLIVDRAAAVGGISGQSNITAANGFAPGAVALPDPYASRSYPVFSKANPTVFPANGIIYPGVYTGPINQGAITMQPGIYYVDAASFSVNGSGSLSGAGVTIVLAEISSQVKPNTQYNLVNGTSPISLTAPVSGPTAGIAIFADPTLKGNFNINGGSTQEWGGAIYMRQADLSFTGGAAGSNGCTQLIANTVSFNGTSNLAAKCSGKGTETISSQIGLLVE
jgi:Flp pilus assembly protein TadG